MNIQAEPATSLEQCRVGQLKPYPNNARTHSPRQIKQIARSIERFGFVNPVLADASGQIIAGHGRVEAAKQLGLTSVPVLRIEHLSPGEIRAYTLADNRLAEKTGWDQELLAIELQGLIDLDFEVELTGFEMGEIDIILNGTPASQAVDDIAEQVPAYESNSCVTFMDWRHLEEMMAAGRQVYSELKNLIVWVKSDAGMGSFYRSRHELVFVWKNGDAPHTNNFELGQFGRSRTNVWEYAGANSFGGERLEQLASHPTCKPVVMLADAIRDCSRRGDLVLDPFAGSGSTLIAAERTGRKARLLELDPHYCDVIVRRWQAITGKRGIQAATNLTFDELEDRLFSSNDKHETLING